MRLAGLKTLAFVLAAVAAVLVSASAVVLAQPPTADSTKTKRILMFSSDPFTPAILVIEDAIRERVRDNADYRIEFYKESLDQTRIPNDKYDAELLSFVRAKYRDIKFDLIFATGTSTITFLLRHEPELFNGVPKVYAALDERQVRDLDLGANTTGIAGKLEFGPTVSIMLSQNPGTKRIVVVSGHSEMDAFLLKQAKKEFEEFVGRVEFAYPEKQTIEQVKQEISALTAGDLVLFINFSRDISGRGYSNPEGLSIVTPTAPVPVYSIVDQGIGSGTVGGQVLGFRLMGENLGEIGLRVLAGENPGNIPPSVASTVPMFDWRQLQKWGINEKTLPPASIVQFKQPTFWEQYKWHAAGVITFGTFETLLILWLLYIRAKRRQAEDESIRFAALAKAEHERLDDVVSNVPGIVWESRLELGTKIRKTQFVSGYVEDMLGYSLEEWHAVPAFTYTIIVDEDRERVARDFDEVFECGGEGTVQYRWLTKDGRVIWVEAHVAAINDETGKPVGLRGVTMDITDRKKAEEKVRERERELTEAQRLAQVGSWEWNPATGAARWSEEMYRIVGLDPTQPPVPFEDQARLHTAESWNILNSTVSDTMQTGTPYKLELELIRDDGRHVWVAARGEVLRNADSLTMRGTLLDITERKNAEEAVRESETRFKQIADSAPVLIWMGDENKKITFANQSWIDFTGWTEEQLKNEGWLELLHKDDRQRSIDIYTAAYERREPFLLEYRIKNADDEFRWLYSRGTPRFADNGDFLGYIGSNVDFTERKAAEESLESALEQINQLKNELHEENIYLKEEIKLVHNFDEIIGHSDALKYVLFKIEQVAPTDATVLITGETGTGKELVARALHSSSGRKDRPLVKVNCAALSPTLIESELFGHERGSFTGAAARNIGRFELADGATIFLDEVGELPLELQAKLLRVIQEGEFERIGSSKTIKADVRIIAATNRNLKDEVKNGRFREDLLFRLNVFPITVPPLRDRKEDVPELVKHFVGQYSRKIGKTISAVSPATLRRLTEYPWPGNIRELANVIERSVITAQDENLRVTDSLETAKAESEPSPNGTTLETVERRHIAQILSKTGGRIEGSSGAARLLGLNPSTLRTRMAKLGISKKESQV